jgi:predicted negative regulator of RcsB-dependent stress response
VSDYDSEKEQIEAIKKWWSANGTWLLLGLAVGFSGLFGYRYYGSYTLQRAHDASTNFENFLSQVEQQQDEIALSTGRAITAEFPSSPYATLTALHMARLAFKQGDADTASAQLAWAREHAGMPALGGLAELRETRLALATGAAETVRAKAEKLAQSDQLLELELAGDIQAANGELDAAVETYERILALEGLDGEDRRLIEMKLDAIGR